MTRVNEYRVNLDIYNGPMDLLLYLIRRDEVDIYDIPIARITEQYVQYVEVLRQVDPNLAGDFLVMASTLMEIKSRTLLPAMPSDEEDGQEGEGLDPRAELVRQLLQYKAFKDAAGDLDEMAHAQSLRFARKPAEVDLDDPDRLDLEDVQVWDLLEAFSKIMADIGSRPTSHDVIYDDTPVELHAEDIMDRLKREGSMSFAKVFQGRSERAEVVGLFLALLELIRQRKIIATQDANFETIQLAVNPRGAVEPPSDQPDSIPDQVPPPAEASNARADTPSDPAPPAHPAQETCDDGQPPSD